MIQLLWLPDSDLIWTVKLDITFLNQLEPRLYQLLRAVIPQAVVPQSAFPLKILPSLFNKRVHSQWAWSWPA